MYAAKTKNKGSFEVFSPDMHSAIRDRLQLGLGLGTTV